MSPRISPKSHALTRGAKVKLYSLVSVLLPVFYLGCASKPLSRVELPQAELPKEYLQKFDVKEAGDTKTPNVTSTSASEAAPAAQALVVPLKSKIRHRRKKKWVLVNAQPAPESAKFVIPNRRPAKDPIWVGEKLDYEITYFGMVAADVTIEVMPFKIIDDHKVYHVLGTARNSKVFGLFYQLNDTAETFIDYNGLFSYRFHLLLNETKQTRDALELYDQEKKQTFYWNRWNHYQRGYLETKEYGAIEPLSQDSISALFYVRTLPLQSGNVVTFPVVSEGKSWEMVVTVIRREMLDTPMGRIPTIVIKPETKFHGVMEKRGDSFMWLTDDDRHLLVRMEAKVKIGTVVARLKKVESLGTSP